MSSDWTCPHCRATLSLTEYGPVHHNDILICGSCITVLLFDQDLTPRIAGPADYRAMSDDMRTKIGHVHRHVYSARQRKIRIDRHSRN